MNLKPTGQEEKKMKKLMAVIVAVMMAAGCVTAFAAGNPMTKEEAMQAALDYAGLKAEQVTFSTIHQDYDDGRQEWDVTIVADGIEYEFEIDALTGRVTGFDRDRSDRYDRYDDDDDMFAFDDIFDFD